MADSHEAFANVDEMVAKPVLGALVTKIIFNLFSVYHPDFYLLLLTATFFQYFVWNKPTGSDGALAWQEFKSTNKQICKGGAAAPNLPMKRTDRLGTGLKSIEEERALENEIRKKSGKAASTYVAERKITMK
jgi:hypothetical protein